MRIFFCFLRLRYFSLRSDYLTTPFDSALLIRVQSLRVARDDHRELSGVCNLSRRTDFETQETQEIVRQQQLYSRRYLTTDISFMTTTAGSPKFLEHADDGTRILNKRRQLFDIKVRCLSLSSYFTRLLAPSITKESLLLSYTSISYYQNRNDTLQRRQSMTRNV